MFLLLQGLRFSGRVWRSMLFDEGGRWRVPLNSHAFRVACHSFDPSNVFTCNEL
jgi:hypothetical protein